MKNKKLIGMVLTFALVFTLAIPATAFAATSFSDTKGHWAETYINKAVSKGIVNGYPDGKFRPDAAVSRAEFITMVNKALGNTGSASVSFSDVPSFEWYYQAVGKAVGSAYTGGYDDGTFRPDAKISRQEAAVMISRIVPTYGYSGSLSKFKDSSQVADWASNALSRVSSKGYIGAYDDGKLYPAASLTRAQTAKIITDIMDKESIVKTTTTLSKDGASLSGKIYSNGVTISKDLDDGEATISNCVILGALNIQGGGEDGILIQNSRVANATVARTSDPVGVVLKGETTVNNLDAEKTATIETSSLAGGDFGLGAKTLNVSGSSADITLSGTFPKVNVDAREAELTLESGTITDLNVTTRGKQSTINVESKATVKNATVDAESYFFGDGTISTMTVQADKVTYEKKPGKLIVGSGVKTKPEEASATSAKFYPANGATGVKDTVKPTITFKNPIETKDGDDITSSYLEKNIVFKKGSSSGTNVSFSAKIDSDDEVITITPDDDLDDGKYYLGFSKSVFRDYDTSDAIAAANVTWNVGSGGTDDSVTFKPEDGATKVSTTVKPTITFDEPIETYSGKTITKTLLDDMIDDNDLYLREEDASSSSNILDSGDASIDTKKKVITISPGTLDNGKYVLGFKSSTFRTVEDGTKIAASSVKFTVGTVKPTASISPKTNVGLNSNITLTFSEKMYNSSGTAGSSGFNSTYLDGAITVKEGSTSVNTSKSIDSTYKKVTISPPSGGWTAGKTYTVSILGSKFKNSAGTYVEATSYTFTTASATPTLSDLKVNNTGVSLTSMRATVQFGSTTASIYAKASNANDTVKIVKAGTSTNAENKSSVTWTDAPLTPGPRASTDFTIYVGTTAIGTLKITIAGPDTSQLDKAIEDAETELSSVVKSTNGTNVSVDQEWVTDDEYRALSDAIAVAVAATTTVTTSAQVDEATLRLRDAIVTFNGAKEKGSKPILITTELGDSIRKAENLKEATKTSTDGSDVDPSLKWATSSEMETFESAITAADNVYKAALASATTTTQEQINNAIRALEEAYNRFNSEVRKAGTKTANGGSGL